LEWWNDGMMGLKDINEKKRVLEFFAQYSIIPVFHR
jgi:hypothetical protein